MVGFETDRVIWDDLGFGSICGVGFRVSLTFRWNWFLNFQRKRLLRQGTETTQGLSVKSQAYLMFIRISQEMSRAIHAFSMFISSSFFLSCFFYNYFSDGSWFLSSGVLQVTNLLRPKPGCRLVWLQEKPNMGLVKLKDMPAVDGYSSREPGGRRTAKPWVVMTCHDPLLVPLTCLYWFEILSNIRISMDFQDTKLGFP